MSVLAFMLWVGTGAFFALHPVGGRWIASLTFSLSPSLRRWAAPVGLASAGLIALGTFVLLGLGFARSGSGISIPGWIVTIVGGVVFVSVQTVAALVTIKGLQPLRETARTPSASNSEDHEA